MTLELIIFAVIILLITVYFVAKHVAKKRRLARPMDIWLTEDSINEKATNMDSFSTYDARLLKKAETLAVWIKLRERYGKRLISYLPVNPMDAERTHRGRNQFGYPIYVKYLSDDGRMLTDTMYIHSFCINDMVVVTKEEFDKIKAGEAVDFSVTNSEIRAMKDSYKDVAPITDEMCEKYVLSDKKRLIEKYGKE